MITVPPREAMRKPLNVRLPIDLRLRLRRAAVVRGTTDAATLRWLLGHALDWWESLPDEQRRAI